MKEAGVPSPFLVAFPPEENEDGVMGGPKVMLDPAFFHGLDEVGSFLAELAGQYARAFLQSGRAMDMEDALAQIRDMLLADLEEIAELGE